MTAQGDMKIKRTRESRTALCARRAWANQTCPWRTMKKWEVWYRGGNSNIHRRRQLYNRFDASSSPPPSLMKLFPGLVGKVSSTGWCIDPSKSLCVLDPCLRFLHTLRHIAHAICSNVVCHVCFHVASLAFVWNFAVCACAIFAPTAVAQL